MSAPTVSNAGDCGPDPAQRVVGEDQDDAHLEALLDLAVPGRVSGGHPGAGEEHTRVLARL